jgi:molybdate transport system regulatory protein
LETDLIVNGPLQVKLQLYCAGLHAMGPGKADLLEAIDREGSISAGGRATGISYRKCWLLVDSMNRTWAGPLIETRFNGGRGGGASLTDLGKEVLAAFRRLEQEVGDATSGQALSLLTQDLLATPRPAKQPPIA